MTILVQKSNLHLNFQLSFSYICCVCVCVSPPPMLQDRALRIRFCRDQKSNAATDVVDPFVLRKVAETLWYFMLMISPNYTRAPPKVMPLSYNKLFFDVVTTIGYAISPPMKKSLHAGSCSSLAKVVTVEK